MATLTVQRTTTAAPYAIEDYETAEETGDEFNNNGRTFLIVDNQDGVENLTVTIVSQATIRGLSVQDPTLTLSASDSGIFGPFPSALFNDADGNVSITYSSASFAAAVLAVSLG